MKFDSFTIAEVVRESDSIRSYRLEPKSGAIPRFEPGNFFLLRLPDGSGKMVQRPYSAASAPWEDGLLFTLKLAGQFTHLIWEAKEGDGIEASGPYGIFTLRNDDAERVFISGGVGVSPFRSMILHTVKKEKKPAHLFHSARTFGELVYFRELGKLASEEPLFNFIPTITGEDKPESFKGLSGRVSAQTLRDRLASLEGRTFYVCGSKEMARSVSHMLVEAGVKKELVRKEEW